MVLKDNTGFQFDRATGIGFTWYAFTVVEGQKPTYLTGSNVKMPILLVDWEKSWNSYGAPTKGGSCPSSHGGLVSTELHLNPLSRYFFLLCPVCGRTFKYLDNTEKLSDLKVVKPPKTTSLDEDTDFPDYWVY